MSAYPSIISPVTTKRGNERGKNVLRTSKGRLQENQAKRKEKRSQVKQTLLLKGRGRKRPHRVMSDPPNRLTK